MQSKFYAKFIHECNANAMQIHMQTVCQIYTQMQ